MCMAAADMYVANCLFTAAVASALIFTQLKHILNK